MNQEWRNLGNDIRDIIQDAVNSQDFRKLNQTVKSAINSAVESVEKSVSRANAQWNRQRDAANGAAGRNGQESPSGIRPPVLYSDALVKRTRNCGLALSICGYVLGIGTAMAIGVITMVRLVVGSLLGFKIANAFLLPLFAAGVFMVWKGSGKLSMVKRFRRYVARLRGQTYCDLKELSAYVGKSKNYVTKDIKKMISGRWFLEGHLDDQETCLIVDDATYHQYRETMRQAEILREEKKKRPELSAEVDAVIRAGEAYLQEIRACNDAIPGVEISEKISRMELVIRRIFDRVEKHPENVDDIQKLMEYYLPTTVKLLKAYEELDSQPVQGDTISGSKKEIEDTLDTLNTAFEKLLDGMFQETSWDVSTDISVLKTLLAQEGLTENDFGKRP